MDSTKQKTHLKTRKSKLKIFLFVVAPLLIVTIGLFIGYTLDYYEAEESAEALLTTTEDVQLLNESPIHFSPTEPSETGIIFYPGGKVEEVAYTPLMQPLAQAGYDTFIADMPFHLAVFDVHAADDIIEDHPEIDHWYVGGHSLGAAMIAVYAEENVEKIDGLFLLAGYSTANLSASDLPLLTLYGSEDQVMDQESVKEYRSNLPKHTIEEEIVGGNHAQFGQYGEQAGDGKATISNEEQLVLTIEYIIEFIEQTKDTE